MSEEEKMEMRRAIAAVMENSAASVQQFENAEDLRMCEATTDQCLRRLWLLISGESIDEDPVGFFLELGAE